MFGRITRAVDHVNHSPNNQRRGLFIWLRLFQLTRHRPIDTLRPGFSHCMCERKPFGFCCLAIKFHFKTQRWVCSLAAMLTWRMFVLTGADGLVDDKVATLSNSELDNLTCWLGIISGAFLGRWTLNWVEVQIRGPKLNRFWHTGPSCPSTAA